MNSNKIIISTDGGARGNPGKAAIGVVITLPNKEKKTYAEQIGETTNNVAEYSALIFALKKTKQLLGDKKSKLAELEIQSDSELMVSQLKGEYRVKNEGLKPLFMEVWNLKQEFKSITFTAIPREQNREADKLVNQALGGK